ncbi:MAG: methyltransferase domain-containing protein, partial [Pseudomonadota bacterium]|nr:methyltransferase domain-containing protein [Pseudomonadota bacterium]
MNTMHVTADADVLRNRAAALIIAGRLGAARPLLAAARALAPQSPDLTLIEVRLALSSGQWEQGMRELDSGIANAPAHAALRKCRAEIRQNMGDTEGAARDAAEAVICDRDDPEAQSILGLAMFALGRDADAVACLTQAVAGAPADPDYRQALSTALEKIGDTNRALLTLTEGIALCPVSVTMRNAAILLCIRRRDFRQATRFAEETRVAGIADACTFGMKGHALSSLGRHEEAALAYQDALKLGPEDPYVRQLVVSSGAMPDAKRDPEEYIRAVFDGYADRFENHLTALGYDIPGAIRSILQRHPKIVAGLSLGPVLDLGCGTGMVALAIGDLPLGPVTGVDLSPRMLAHARVKRVYTELRETDIITDLATSGQRWPLIVAADVLIYFGPLEELFALVHRSLEPGGWFVFSLEEMLPDYDGVVPGNGNWALHRQGRYVHAQDYVYEAACAAGFRVSQINHPVIRHEAGTTVPGLLLVLERIRDDD